MFNVRLRCNVPSPFSRVGDCIDSLWPFPHDRSSCRRHPLLAFTFITCKGVPTNSCLSNVQRGSDSKSSSNSKCCSILQESYVEQLYSTSICSINSNYVTPDLTCSIIRINPIQRYYKMLTLFRMKVPLYHCLLLCNTKRLVN